MATASYLIADVQTKLGDPSGNIYTSANLLNWLDQAQKEFALKTLVLRWIDATSVSTGFMRIPIATDTMMIEGLVTSRGRIPRKLKRVSPTDFFNQQTAVQGVLATDPVIWTEMDQNIYVYPRYNGLSATTLVSGAIASGDTSIGVATTAGFRQLGRIGIASGGAREEIEYQIASTGVFQGVTRGLAQTTANSYSSNATVTQLDLWVIYRRVPVVLGTVTATPEIRQIYHEKLELYVMYLCYKQTGEEDKAREMYQLWEAAIADAMYSASREHLGPQNVRDFNTQQITGLYGAV